MKVCPYCHKELPEDSVFCTYCGKPLEKYVQKEDTSSEGKSVEEKQELKENPRKNSWGKLGLMLFFIALIIFDFVLGTVFNAIGWNQKIPFYLSAVVYALSMVCGIISLVTDHKAKKNGYEPNGSYGMSIVSIVLSLFMVLINVTQVILV